MRAIDHLVLPFADLAAARDWFSALGFTVAPNAVHPFGTGNACVFFEDGTFLEPLAVVDPAAYEAARSQENPFVVRDAAFRKGATAAISALALHTKDAGADRDALRCERVGEDGMIAFGRMLTLADGSRSQLSFRLSFATIDRPDGPNFFFCEARHEIAPDRSTLTGHPNGATGLAGVEFSATDPAAARAYLRKVLRAGEAVEDDRAPLPAWADCIEVKGPGVPALSISAATIRVRDLAALRERLAATHLSYEDDEDLVAVACPNGPGEMRFIQEFEA